jgi:glutamate-1-semialdehyde 2,1-aminomutase
MIEPTGSHMGVHPIPPSFLHELRELTERTGTIFHMDEVVTGFRLSKGGASRKFEVTPDITTLAKILGGGLPGGAVAGKSDIINLIEFKDDASYNHNQRVGHPGTFNANPISAAAGAAALELVRDTDVNEKTDAAGNKLKAGLNELLGKMEIPGQVTGHGPLLFVRLGVDFEVEDDGATFELTESEWATVNDGHRNSQLHLALLNEGVDPMSNGTRLIIGQDHSDQDIENTISAYEKALGSVRQSGLL